MGRIFLKRKSSKLESWAWEISLPLYFNFVHGKYWKFNSWGYPLNLLAKVNSHAYVGLYFEFTWIVHEMLLENFDSCVTKRVCQCEGIIHVSLQELLI